MTKIKSFTSAAPKIFVIVSASLSKVRVVRREDPKAAQGLLCLHAVAVSLTPQSSHWSALSPPAMSSPSSGQLLLSYSWEEGCISLSSKGEKSFLKVVKYG